MFPKKVPLFWSLIKGLSKSFCSIPHSKLIPNAGHQIQKFESLQFKLSQYTKRMDDLSKQVELAQIANITTTVDLIRKVLCRMTGSHFQTAAVKKLRQQLIRHRTQLERKIQESDIKWQGPREKILKLRKQIANDFLCKFIHLQDQMQKIIDLKLQNTQLAQGVQLTHRLLLNTLQKHGIQFFQPEIGSNFNDKEQQGAQQKPQATKIKQVLARGWRIDGKIIKKAIIKLE